MAKTVLYTLAPILLYRLKGEHMLKKLVGMRLKRLGATGIREIAIERPDSKRRPTVRWENWDDRYIKDYY